MQRLEEGKRTCTVGILYLWLLHLQIKSTTDQKYLGKTIPESSEKQNLNLLCTRAYLHSIYNYLHTIYIGLGIISDLEMV